MSKPSKADTTRLSENKLTHIDDAGKANMVDVGDKAITQRIATAEGFIQMNTAALSAIVQQNNKKGDVLSVARVAAIMAAKQTSALIPLCHTLALSKVQVDFKIVEGDVTNMATNTATQNLIQNGVHVTTMAKCNGNTGVEMEALTAASVACLTLFDMCKALDPSMTITNIKVVTKQGGKTGNWQA